MSGPADSVRDVELHHQVCMSRRKKVTPVFDLGVRGLAPDPKSLSDLQPEPDPNHIADEKSAPQTNSKPTGVRRKKNEIAPIFGTGSIHSKPLPPSEKVALAANQNICTGLDRRCKDLTSSAVICSSISICLASEAFLRSSFFFPQPLAPLFLLTATTAPPVRFVIANTES